MRRFFLPAAIVGLMTVGLFAAETKYGVKATYDKKTDFSAFKTYSWSGGLPAADKAIHQQLVAAIDQQLAALGLQKKESGPADVVVLYAAVRRTDVDLKSEMNEQTKMRREYPAGTLVIIFRDPTTSRELFKGRADKVLDSDPSKLKELLDTTVKEIFARYPGKKST